MEQSLQVLVLKKEEPGVVGYNTGRVIVYPFFSFFVLKKQALRNVRKKLTKEEKRAGCDFS